MKKLIPAAFAALSVGSVLADTNSVSVAGVGQVGGAMQTAFSSAATALTPIIVSVICIGVGLWLIPRVVGILKRAFSSGKGR